MKEYVTTAIQVDLLKNSLALAHPKGTFTAEYFNSEMREAGRNKPYDCIVGVSGGDRFIISCRSCEEQWELRPLAVHYDNTWNSAIATMNIQKILSNLDVDLYTHVVSNKEVDDIFTIFLFCWSCRT